MSESHSDTYPRALDNPLFSSCVNGIAIAGKLRHQSYSTSYHHNVLDAVPKAF